MPRSGTCSSCRPDSGAHGQGDRVNPGRKIRSALAGFLVAVDVGHYAAEPGVISAGGVPEFAFNLALALDVMSELEKSRIKVRLIGERGDYAVLHHRTRDARGADLFVSIHHDSVQERPLPQADRFAGFSLFISRTNPFLEKSLACASSIGARMRKGGFTPSKYRWLLK